MKVQDPFIANHIINEAAQKAVREIAIQANKGLSFFNVRFWAPSYDDGSAILKLIELEGVQCCELGFASKSQSDGSYNFNVKLQNK